MLVLVGRTDLPRGAKAGGWPQLACAGGDAPRVDRVGGAEVGLGCP